MNMMKMMKQAQQLQKTMQTKQAELAETEVSFSAGGGAVEVVATCDFSVKSVKIKAEVVDPTDVEMLEDLVTAAVSGAMAAAQDKMKTEMGSLMPAGMGGMPF